MKVEGPMFHVKQWIGVFFAHSPKDVPRETSRLFHPSSFKKVNRPAPAAVD